MGVAVLARVVAAVFAAVVDTGTLATVVGQLFSWVSLDLSDARHWRRVALAASSVFHTLCHWRPDSPPPDCYVNASVPLRRRSYRER
jgi:hypothetical protein